MTLVSTPFLAFDRAVLHCSSSSHLFLSQSRAFLCGRAHGLRAPAETKPHMQFPYFLTGRRGRSGCSTNPGNRFTSTEHPSSPTDSCFARAKKHPCTPDNERPCWSPASARTIRSASWKSRPSSRTSCVPGPCAPRCDATPGRGELRLNPTRAKSCTRASGSETEAVRECALSLRKRKGEKERKKGKNKERKRWLCGGEKRKNTFWR